MVAFPFVVCQNRVLQELNLQAGDTYTLREEIAYKKVFAEFIFVIQYPKTIALRKNFFVNYPVFLHVFFKNHRIFYEN